MSKLNDSKFVKLLFLMWSLRKKDRKGGWSEEKEASRESLGLPRWHSGKKNPPATAGDAGDLSLIPGSGRSPGVANGNPHKYSCLENSMDRGAWQATVHRATKNPTWLSTTTTGKALYASSKYQIKKTSRNKFFEFSAQNSLHEDAALFHLESGSLSSVLGRQASHFQRAPEKQQSLAILLANILHKQHEAVAYPHRLYRALRNWFSWQRQGSWMGWLKKQDIFQVPSPTPHFQTTSSNCILTVYRNLIGKKKAQEMSEVTKQHIRSTLQRSQKPGTSQQICQNKVLELHILAAKGCSVVSHRRAQSLR